MILAIHAPDRARLERVRASPDPAGVAGPLAERFGPLRRLYVGVAFCQHLMPDLDEVLVAMDVARRRELGLTLLTGYLTDDFLERHGPILDALIGAEDLDPELVVEDWGMLRRARERHPTLRLVLGRGLNRLVRDPRVPDTGPEHLRGDAPPGAWRAGSFGGAAFRALLRRVGVDRVETDVPLQGLNPGGGDGLALGAPPESPLPTSVHLPYGLVATGRICLVSGYGKPPSVRFAPPAACDAPCRRTVLTLRAPWSRRDAGSEHLPVPDGAFLPLSKLLNRRRNELPDPEGDAAPRFLQKGNTHFYRLEGGRLEAAIAWAQAEPSVDRVVVPIDLPM